MAKRLKQPHVIDDTISMRGRMSNKDAEMLINGVLSGLCLGVLFTIMTVLALGALL